MVGTLLYGVQIIMIAIAFWAFIDCAIRPSQAFPAIDRQTKPAWLFFTGLAAIVQVIFGGIGLLGIAAIVLSGYYLTDVRTRVLEITRGR